MTALEEIRDRLELLRVVRCLSSGTDVHDLDAVARTGVAQASREETAACPDAVRGS
jgi:hypothetical protein